MTQFHLGKSEAGRPVAIAGRFATRHGLITGATGTGKSYTIARLVEQFTGAGVPVFLVDVKGDLAGIARNVPSDLFAPAGQPGALFSIRCDAIGADSMARALELTDAQSGALAILFAWARDNRRPLGSLADLSAALTALEHARKRLSARYGHLTPASLAVIRRALLRLESAPCQLFGAGNFEAARLVSTGGRATILDATRLYHCPTLYGAAMPHVLESLFAHLPERGDADLPRLAVFIDEAHLIFADLPAPLVQRIERIVRLIRSKGVALFFASQSPADLPAPILGQLGNRIQHGLRGATPADLRAIRAAADTMPVNPAINAGDAIVRLGVGQALVSTIGRDGVPTPCEIVRIAPPQAGLAPLSPEQRAAIAPDLPEPAAPEALLWPRIVLAIFAVLILGDLLLALR